MKIIFWLLLLLVVRCEAAFAQNQSIDELRRLFDYDQSAPLDIKEVSVINRNGIQIHDINFASPKSGRITAYLVVPAERGRFAGVLWYDTGHELNDVRALVDRANWLQRYIGMKAIASILGQTLTTPRTDEP